MLENFRREEDCLKDQAERIAAQRKAEYENQLIQISEENKGRFLGLGKKAQI